VGRGFPDFFQNVVQTQCTEGRRALWNDAGSTDDFDTATRVGKFFPRGARGFIGSVKAYLKNTDTVSRRAWIQLAIHPGAPALAEVWITQDAKTTGWASEKLNTWWNYDSLFIFVRGLESGLSVGFDTGTPYDSFAYDSATAKWEAETKRRYLRVDAQGQTPGDVPVSGTISVVEILSITSMLKYGEATVPAGESYDVRPTFGGTGKITNLTLRTAGVDPRYVEVHIVIDRTDLSIKVADVLHVLKNQSKTYSPISLNFVDLTLHDYSFSFNYPLSFRESFRIYVKNTSTASLDIYWLYSCELIK